MADSFASLGLSADLVRAVAEQGYTTPTPVQVEAIPVILAGSDVLARAQTGTGKTAGFTLPMLQRLAAAARRPTRGEVRALVLTPTRELAAQVEASVRDYGRHTRLSSTLVFGGVGFKPQADALRRGVDVLVATPGRLLDHVGQRTVDLRRVEILVLDEADRMLDMGFIHDIRRILALLPPERQNLLFSATFSDDIRALAGSLLHDAVEVQVARPNSESALVEQRVHPVDRDRKRELLAHLVASGNWQQVLVFTRTKHGANALAERLSRDGLEAAAIHGNKSQGARTRALAGFKAGDVRLLVATDIAARGLDIEQLPHVVNYELPNVPEDYVHRIGRTGRAGSNGEAISLVCADEQAYLADIERLLKRTLPRQVIAGFEPSAKASVVPARVAERGRVGRNAAPRATEHPRADRPPLQRTTERARAGRNPAPRTTEHPRPNRPPAHPAIEQPRPNRPPAHRAAEQSRPGRPPAHRAAEHAARAGAEPPRRQSQRHPSSAAAWGDQAGRRGEATERQPASNASAQFPSTGAAFGARAAGDRAARRPHAGNRGIPALLAGSARRDD